MGVHSFFLYSTATSFIVLRHMCPFFLPTPLPWYCNSRPSHLIAALSRARGTFDLGCACMTLRRARPPSCPASRTMPGGTCKWHVQVARASGTCKWHVRALACAGPVAADNSCLLPVSPSRRGHPASPSHPSFCNQVGWSDFVFKSFGGLVEKYLRCTRTDFSAFRTTGWRRAGWDGGADRSIRSTFLKPRCSRPGLSTRVP